MRGFAQHPRLRVTVLVACAAGVATRGAAYLDTSRDLKSLAWIDKLIPMQGWAMVWFAAALFILAGIWHRDVARWGMSLGSSMYGFWGLNYLFAWFLVDTFTTRIWLTGSALVLIAVLMWVCAALMDSVGPPPRPAVPKNGVLPVEDPPT